MKQNWIRVITWVVLMTIITTSPVNGKRLLLRPLSATEVYDILRSAGREDAVPEGRVVTQGIAAATGFVLGLTKGIGGSLLVDLATNLFKFGNSGNTTVQISTQEICFSSRSLNEIDDSEDDVEAMARQAATTTETLTSPTMPATSTYTDTTNDTGGTSGTDTQTTSTTGSTTNCIVINKPLSG
ncbi:uncharacterized protein LOC119674804 [Teleopsis dalmanni]|uniref:uncharacterized protein LOC119674804 n=1 Tax=Teleopsis dalmanni TaxID=139649 RepID=UPI0018CE9065|nr:uncharacterized protein LOC119674804 [Teleopsis dalmanni]